MPELAGGIIEIKAVARIPGLRTKIAVHSRDANTDSVGVCVGDRGSRIKGLVDAFNGERIDIVRWSEDSRVFIRNCLQPATINRVEIDASQQCATVVVCDDQQLLALGRNGENQKLASELCGYNIEIVPLDDSGNGPSTREECCTNCLAYAPNNALAALFGIYAESPTT